MSSTPDVLGMSMVRGMREGGELCLALADKRIGEETGGVLDVCLGCGGAGGGRLVPERVVLYLCEFGFFVYMAGPGICILC